MASDLRDAQFGQDATPSASRFRRSTAPICHPRRGPFPWRLRLLPWRAGRPDQPDRATACCRRRPILRHRCGRGATASCSGSSSTASNIPACRPGWRSSATTKSGRRRVSAGVCRRSTPTLSRSRAGRAVGSRRRAGASRDDRDAASEAVGACARCHGAEQRGPGERARAGPARAAGEFLVAALAGLCTAARAPAASCSRSRAISTPENCERVARYYAGLAAADRAGQHADGRRCYRARTHAGDAGRSRREDSGLHRLATARQRCKTYPRLAGQNAAYMVEPAAALEEADCTRIPTTEAHHGADRAVAERAADRGRLGVFRVADAAAPAEARPMRCACVALGILAGSMLLGGCGATCSRCWRRTVRRRGRSRPGLAAVRVRRARPGASSSPRCGWRSAARRGSRRALAQESAVIALGIVFPAVDADAAAGLRRLADASRISTGRDDAMPCASRWSASNGGGASPIPAPTDTRSRAPTRSAFRSGAPVEFALKAADVIHSFWVPSLGGKLDMIPGRTTRLRLTAERPGIYRGQCAEYCGGPHALMALRGRRHAGGRVTTLACSARRPGAARRRPRSSGAGRSLFLAAGCGACHAVRGTAAARHDRPRPHACRRAPLGRHRHAAADGATISRASSSTASTSSPATSCRDSASSQPPSCDALAAYLAEPEVSEPMARQPASTTIPNALPRPKGELEELEARLGAAEGLAHRHRRQQHRHRLFLRRHRASVLPAGRHPGAADAHCSSRCRATPSSARRPTTRSSPCTAR